MTKEVWQLYKRRTGYLSLCSIGKILPQKRIPWILFPDRKECTLLVPQTIWESKELFTRGVSGSKPCYSLSSVSFRLRSWFPPLHFSAWLNLPLQNCWVMGVLEGGFFQGMDECKSCTERSVENCTDAEALYYVPLQSISSVHISFCV